MQQNTENSTEVKKSGFRGGDANINRNGRPKNSEKEEKLTNRQLREKAFLELVRKFRPLQAKAILEVVRILEKDTAAEASKLKAAALIISTYKDLIAETYDYKYDDEAGEAMQKDSEPVFSLKVVE